ncbi:histidine phosphatase family protein [Pseudomonas sp. NPDC088414]|uniref:histidine phosphatase family protein n=1 Tax=Pseudomonas sp. NPDC088414 TaxID=3364454 RepID=UPI0038256CB5
MIIFIRHGETEFNINNLWMGQTDLPLNENGFDQAQLAGEKLGNIAFEAIYTSQLKRAHSTALTIQRMQAGHPQVIIESRFQERGFGDFEGLEKTFERRKKLEFAIGVETINSLKSRLLSGFKDIPLEKDILIVSHSAVFRCLIENLQFSTGASVTQLGNGEFTTIIPPKHLHMM